MSQYVANKNVFSERLKLSLPTAESLKLSGVLGMSYRTGMNGTTSKLFHAGQIDARVVATAARDRQCRRQLLNQVDKVLTPAPVCGEQQVIVDSGNRHLGAVIFPVRGLS